MPQQRNPKKFSVKVWNKKHLANLNKRLSRVQRLIDEAANKATRIAVRTSYTDTSKDFRFDDFPQARREIDALLGELSSSLSSNVESASSEAWGMANQKNDAMVDAMLASSGVDLGKKATRRWYNKNERALKAFLKRRETGMGLSSDVWKLDQFKGELELALEMGLGRGRSAAELSRDVRSFLKYPNKLFRRVKDEKGNLRLSRAAQEYHPGQGVYRSSYKNALRLTATETNMAYRMADSRRWQQMEWVLGIRVSVSKTNHPEADICDELQGDYPKDFVFTGWHPFCKCFAVAIQPSPDEFMEYINASDEEQENWQWDGQVKDVPDNFKSWVEDNEERISQAKSQPYFMKDNPKYTNIAEPEQPKRKTAQEIAKERHAARTQEDIERIQYEWNNHRINNMYDEVRKLNLPEGVYDTLEQLRDDNELFDFGIVRAKLDTLQAAVRRHDARTLTERKIIRERWARRTADLEAKSALSEVIKSAQAEKIDELKVKMLSKTLTSENIIKKLAGGDMTGGSCSSLAFAYAGNRAGFDVVDYRGGKSRSFFARTGNIMKIAEKVGGVVTKHTNDFKKAKDMLATVVEGKEYYFTCGAHAAIVRKTAKGFEYLEMQSSSANGWKPLDDSVLKWRFGAKKSHTIYGTKVKPRDCIIEIDKLKGDFFGFRKLLSFLNTKKTEQKKGKFGSIK